MIDTGECDSCTGSYELSSRDNRCGNCGNCDTCCTHKGEGDDVETISWSSSNPTGEREIAL